jgi:hypothetical protein
MYIPYNQHAAGWETQAWNNGYAGSSGFHSAQGFPAQAAYGHAPMPFYSYNNSWGFQQEGAAHVLQQPLRRRERQQKQRLPAPAGTMQAAYSLLVSATNFATIPQAVPAPHDESQVVPAPRNDDDAMLLQRAESSIAIIDMAFPKSETRSGSVEAAAAAPFAQGPAVVVQEKADVGVGGGRRQPGPIAVAQQANR